MPDLAESPAVEETPAVPKRPRKKTIPRRPADGESVGGRPRKDGAPPGSIVIAPSIPNAPHLKYYSDHNNSHQKTRALWTWWGDLPTPFKNQIVAYVYREWPVLLDPVSDWCPECKLIMSPELANCPRCGAKLEAQESKYIDTMVGTAPVQNDQDFIDKYGAGDYRLYLNANPPAPAKGRTLATAFIKGSHDFRTYVPTDKRIQDIANLSLTDPLNAAYVAWLRSQGKIPDEEKAKERDDMAASGVLVEKLLDRVDTLTDRVMEKNAEPPPAPVETPQQQTIGMFEIIERIQKLTEGRNGNSPDVGAIMQSAIAMAQAISKANDPSVYLQKISELEAQIRKQEAEARQKVLDEIREEVRSLKANPGGANGNTTVIPTKSLGEQLKEARELFRELDLGDDGPTGKAPPWWGAPLMNEEVVKKGVELLGAITQHFLTPQPQATANPGSPFPGPAEQQLPPPQPQQAQPQPTQEPPRPQPTPEQLEVQRIMVAIAAPVIDALSAEDSGGDDFADFMCQEFGMQAYRFLSKYETDQIVGELYRFPLIAPRMGQFLPDKVRKFVEEFKAYNREQYDAKVDAREKGGAA